MDESEREAELLTSLGRVLEDARDRLQACTGPAGAERALPPAAAGPYRRRLSRLDAEVMAAEAAGDLAALVQAVTDRERLFADLRGLLESIGAGTAAPHRVDGAVAAPAG